MQVSATKAISNFTGRVLFLGGLFLFVIMAQGAIVSALRGLNIAGGPALLISGALILPAVLIVAAIARASGRASARKLDAQREAAGLPPGACCVVLRPQQAGQAEFPWELQGDVRAVYPKLPKRLGIEGYALVDFEIGADGAAKNLHCIEVWPAPVFYEAAAEALRAARFGLRPGAAVRFGPSYRIPFVFRIRGAARVRDKGRSAITPLAHGTKRTAVGIGRGLWIGLKVLAIIPVVLFREIGVFLGWCVQRLADLLEKIAAHLRNLKRT